MIRLETIRVNSYPEPDRQAAAVQSAADLERDPRGFLDRYREHPHTFGGRYVCADSAKELFSVFARDADSRNRFNGPVHNAAAVLASAAFHAAVATPRSSAHDTAYFLTGVPGAGKTSSVLQTRPGTLHPTLPADAAVVYEGQLARPSTGTAKIQAALDAGLAVHIVAVHVPPERAMDNTLRRFHEYGRGASIETMAAIQGGQADGLAAIRSTFRDRVQFSIRDLSDPFQPKRLIGWDNLDKLREFGNVHEIRTRLDRRLEQHIAAGTVADAGRRQARSEPTPEPGISDLAGRGGRGLQAHGSERGRALQGGPRAVLSHREVLEASHYALHLDPTELHQFAARFDAGIVDRSHRLSRAHGERLAAAFLEDPTKPIDPSMVSAVAARAAAARFIAERVPEASRARAQASLDERIADSIRRAEPLPPTLIREQSASAQDLGRSIEERG